MTLPPLVHNRLSYAGAAIAVLMLIAIAFLFILDLAGGTGEAPYAGIVIFIVLPSIMLGGLALIPLGMLLEWRHVRRTGTRSIPTFPVVDLNQPAHRNAAAIFAVGSILLLFLSVFGSYQAYEHTESVAFCGTTCHTVMEPEFVTYQNSPHARVRCVDCHVGPGADWYVKSKMAGLYQVYAVAFDKYPRPIPATITDLRPAQETCEQCHWPEQFFGAQQKRIVHFLADETNSRWEFTLLLKVGGAEPIGQQGHGIHWHMNIANRIEYIAVDPDRQDIPWVRLTNPAGETTVYRSTESELTDEQIAAAEIRVMDCMDCHNRPSHILRSPRESLNRALLLGEIDPTLPSIKQVGIDVLIADYDSVEEATNAIDAEVRTYYRENANGLLESRADDVRRAIGAIQEIYRLNFFPKMKARWDAYPSNTGHLTFPGCMRCHGGLHESADGEVITTDCRACHTIMSQGPADDVRYSTAPEGLDFEHPGGVGDDWQSMLCSDCHAGE
jgi:hypothetical protein